MNSLLDLAKSRILIDVPLEMTAIEGDLPFEITDSDLKSGLEMAIQALSAGRYWAAYNVLDCVGYSQYLNASLSPKVAFKLMNSLYLLASSQKPAKKGMGFEAIDQFISRNPFIPKSPRQIIVMLNKVANQLK